MLSAEEKVEELYSLLQAQRNSSTSRRTGGGDSGGSEPTATSHHLVVDSLERRLRQAEGQAE